MTAAKGCSLLSRSSDTGVSLAALRLDVALSQLTCRCGCFGAWDRQQSLLSVTASHEGTGEHLRAQSTEQPAPADSHGAQTPTGAPCPPPPHHPAGATRRQAHAYALRHSGTSVVSSSSSCLPHSQNWLCEICAGSIRLIAAPVQSRCEMHRLAVLGCILMVRELRGSRQEEGKEPDCSSWLPAIDLLPGLLMNV